MRASALAPGGSRGDARLVRLSSDLYFCSAAALKTGPPCEPTTSHLPNILTLSSSVRFTRRQGHHLELQTAALAFTPPAERTCALREVDRPLKAVLVLSAEQGCWFEASPEFCCDIWTEPSANEASCYICSPPFSASYGASKPTRCLLQRSRFLVSARSFNFTPIFLGSLWSWSVCSQTATFQTDTRVSPCNRRLTRKASVFLHRFSCFNQ